MIDRLYLSPEFPLIAGFFLLICIFLLVKILQLWNEVKSRKSMDAIFETLAKGDTAMKPEDLANMFNQVPTPATGNQARRMAVFGGLVRTSQIQAQGLVDNIALLSLAKAQNGQEAQMSQMIQQVGDMVDQETGVTQKNHAIFEAQALGNGAPAPETQQLEQQGAAPASPETPPPAEAPVTQEVSQGEGVLTEELVKEKMAEMKCVQAYYSSVGMTSKDEYKFADCPKLVENLGRYFSQRSKLSNATEEDKKLADFFASVQKTDKWMWSSSSQNARFCGHFFCF